MQYGAQMRWLESLVTGTYGIISSSYLNVRSFCGGFNFSIFWFQYKIDITEQKKISV